MARTKLWIASHKTLAIFGGIALALVIGVAFVGVANATNSPTFCRAACHEMQPYHDAWSEGPHKDISCIECHVDPGQVAQLKHKVVALGEVATHFRGDTSFPREVQAEVPNERCIRCHSKISVDGVGFDHAVHAKRGPCMKCHADVGHKVTVASLKAAGYYSGFTGSGASAESTTAVVDGGQANLEGHIKVTCSRCHIMAANPCSGCHKPKHVVRGECTTCHAPGEKFVFAHPKDRADCQTCHTPKPTHTKIKGECAECHKEPGVKWSFKHPAATTNCMSCHDRPEGHRQGTCSTCHATGVSWKFSHPRNNANCESCHSRPARHRSGSCTTCHAVGPKWTFRHPSNGANCTSCHNRPAGHRSGSCTTCHRVGSSWSFRHPGNGASCAPCHNRPSGHRSGSCSSCHRVGSRWVFKHPSSSSCSSCHNPPSKHYGSSCSGCHSPSRAWRSATFRHPGIPGGEHRYTSFACVKCHPGDGRGPGHYCSCHGNTTGPKDD